MENDKTNNTSEPTNGLKQLSVCIVTFGVAMPRYRRRELYHLFHCIHTDIPNLADIEVAACFQIENVTSKIWPFCLFLLHSYIFKASVIVIEK